MSRLHLNLAFVFVGIASAAQAATVTIPFVGTATATIRSSLDPVPPALNAILLAGSVPLSGTLFWSFDSPPLDLAPGPSSCYSTGIFICGVDAISGGNLHFGVSMHVGDLAFGFNDVHARGQLPIDAQDRLTLGPGGFTGFTQSTTWTGDGLNFQLTLPGFFPDDALPSTWDATQFPGVGSLRAAWLGPIHLDTFILTAQFHTEAAEPVHTPEPTSLALLVLGCGIAWRRFR